MPTNQNNLITDANGALVKPFVDTIALATEAHAASDVFILRLYDHAVDPQSDPGVQVRMSPQCARRLAQILQDALSNYAPGGLPKR